MNSTGGCGAHRGQGLGHRAAQGLEQPGEQLPVALHQLLHLVFLEGKGACCSSWKTRRGTPGCAWAKATCATNTARSACCASPCSTGCGGVCRRCSRVADPVVEHCQPDGFLALEACSEHPPLGDANGLCQRGRGDFGGPAARRCSAACTSSAWRSAVLCLARGAGAWLLATARMTLSTVRATRHRTLGLATSLGAGNTVTYARCMQQRTLGPFSSGHRPGLDATCLTPMALRCLPTSRATRPAGLRCRCGCVTLFDTATLYGFGANETLVGRVMKPHRHRFTLASKCGMQGVDVNGDGKLVRVIDGAPRHAAPDLRRQPAPPAN